LSNFKLLGVLH